MSNDNMFNIIEGDIQEAYKGSMDAVYRPAFPRYKVFIFGQEVSSDVISIRVNQSGGSLERTPSTLSISILNRYDKYILTHEDMVYIGAYKEAVKNGQNPEDINVTYSPEAFGYEYANPIVGKPHFNKAGKLISDLMGRTPEHPIGQFYISSATMSELVTRLKNSSVEEARYTVDAFLSNLKNENGKYVESSYRGLTSSQLDSLVSELKQLSDKGAFDEFGEWGEEELTLNVKKEVVEKKLDKAKNLYQAVAPSNSGSIAVKDIEGPIFRYPMQEGDFIFNLNDPVRVAVRDPFNPQIWYWMFTGFVDTWTESSDVNLHSTINVTCTDVTKMARYAITNVTPGLVDVNLEDLLEVLNKSGDQAVNQAGLVLTQNVFEGLTVLEIMELTFFGSDAAADLVKSSQSAYIDILDQIDDDDDDGLLSFMITTLNLSIDQARSYLVNESGDNATFTEKKKKLEEYINTSRGKKQIERINTLGWQGLTGPGNISFKRKGVLNGVDFRVYGSEGLQPSAADSSFGAEVVKDFYTWNEQLHHRVKKSDLVTMMFVDPRDSNEQVYSDLFQDELLQDMQPATLTIEQVIDTIGTDLDKYPVGHGKVYYMAPAGMSELLGDGIVNKAMGGVESFHSVFKDRLTMLYDIAESLEWRFYATPRGDVVMEHPFYDYDPQEFFKSKSLAENLSETNREDFERYDKIFGQAYAGDYEDPTELTRMAFEFNTDNQALRDYIDGVSFSYANMFTVGIDEQISFSNTNTDKGLVTVFRAKPHVVKLLPGLGPTSAQQFVYAIDKTLVPSLGFRLQDGNLQEYISSEEGAKIYCALKLNQVNAESRSLGLETIPKFGLMVNRPLFWRYRNYYCNIISCTHSISWNSDLTTSINVNQIRAWSGTIEEKSPRYYHFGDNNRPFNWAEAVKRSFKSSTTSRKQDQENSGDEGQSTDPNDVP